MVRKNNQSFNYSVYIFSFPIVYFRIGSSKEKNKLNYVSTDTFLRNSHRIKFPFKSCLLELLAPKWSGPTMDFDVVKGKMDVS